MLVRASLLAKAHLSLDRRMLKAWMTSEFPRQLCKQTRTKIIHKTVVQAQLERCHPDEVTADTAVWTRIWHILSSVCITHLWMQRNRVTFQQEDVTLAGSVHKLWESGMKQLRVIAKRECRRTDTKIQGTYLMLCQRALSRQPGEPPPQVASPVQPPDSHEESALLTRLTINQTSCNH